MAYSIEVVKRARARLAQAREDRESENRQHLAEAYAKVPRIREIDMELRRTMAMAAQAAFLQGSDGRAEMDKVRAANLQLQRERARLAEMHFEEGYLDDSPATAAAAAATWVPRCANVWRSCAARSRRRKCLFFLETRSLSINSDWTFIPTNMIPNIEQIRELLWKKCCVSAAHMLFRFPTNRATCYLLAEQD